MFYFFISLLSKYINISVFNISGVLYYLFFFILGIYIFNNKEFIFKILTNIKLIAINIILFALLFLLKLKNIDIIPLFNYMTSIFIAISGIIMSFQIALVSTENNIKFAFGIFDGLYYQIYLLSWFFQTGMRIFYQIHLINYTSVTVLMLISSIIFPLLIVYLIKKYLTKLKIFIGL